MSHKTTEQRASLGLKPTLQSIKLDLDNNNATCLYYASEEQINKLITQNKIDSDYQSIHEDYQEEVRVLIAEARSEFS